MEGAKTPEDDSTGGENKGAGKGGEPQAKKRKIFPKDPKNVESPDAGTECVSVSVLRLVVLMSTAMQHKQ